MAKILFNDCWFEELAPNAVYEASFEAVLMTQAEKLWPEYFAVPFKSTVYSSDGAARADFALVERNYKEWWVGEVEMGRHSLDGHVLPQVRTLASASYGTSEAEKLCQADSRLSSERMQDLMKGKQPKILVVVNTPRPDWVAPLNRYDAWLAIVEAFRSERNEFVYRVNGKHPSGAPEVVTVCRYDAVLPRWLVVESPASLGGKHGDRFQVLHEERITEWIRVDIADKVYLRADSVSPLPTGQDFEILKRPDSSLSFRQLQQRKRQK
jgi:hypothetical protein